MEEPVGSGGLYVHIITLQHEQSKIRETSVNSCNFHTLPVNLELREKYL